MRTLRGALLVAYSLVAVAPAVALDLPLRGSDLLAGERFDTTVHAVTGEQDEGKDIVVSRHTGNNRWTRMKPRKSDDRVNANHLAYGKPVYAMAPGRVVACWRNAPENRPPDLHTYYKLGRITGDGNHLWVLQEDGRRALYAHFKPGSVPPELCPHNGRYVSPMKDAAGNQVRDGNDYILGDKNETQVANGARVAAGQKIGEIGNSGSSGGPHLHVHIQDASGAPSEMRFSRGLTTPFPNFVASLDGPWTPLAGGPLPKAQILIWPPRPAGNATFNGIGASAFQRTFEHFVDSGMMPDTISCRNNGAVYDTTWVPTQGTFIAHARMSPLEYPIKKLSYAAEGWRLVSEFQCGTVIAAIWRK